MKAKIAKKSSKTKSRAKKVVRAAADEPTGCGYIVNWSVVANLRGYTQVWVKTKTYDKVAADLIKGVKGKEAKGLLRQRKQAIGINYACGGTCTGGWCQEHMIDEGIYVCECGYFT
jgi:hypothetical protein